MRSFQAPYALRLDNQHERPRSIMFQNAYIGFLGGDTDQRVAL